jgi:hypothetical protein
MLPAFLSLPSVLFTLRTRRLTRAAVATLALLVCGLALTMSARPAFAHEGHVHRPTTVPHLAAPAFVDGALALDVSNGFLIVPWLASAFGDAQREPAKDESSNLRAADDGPSGACAEVCCCAQAGAGCCKIPCAQALRMSADPPHRITASLRPAMLTVPVGRATKPDVRPPLSF